MSVQNNAFRFETRPPQQPVTVGASGYDRSQKTILWEDPLTARLRRESRLQPVPQELNNRMPPNALFGRLLDWSFCQFGLNPSTLPPALSGQPGIAALLGQDLILFNVLVALEWPADAEYLDKLRRAFEQASDLLYDVTDGYMAIGQVVFGGQELMDCADIQIFASNRLFPRSSVNGLNEERKYQPIRLGRGLWNKKKRRTTSWEQNNPKDGELGPQTLVHEWGHYALGLKDQYLILNRDFVIPSLSPVANSIMADVRVSEIAGADDSTTDESVSPEQSTRRLVQTFLSPKQPTPEFVPTILSTKQPTPTLVSRVVSTHRLDDNNEWRLLSQHPQYKSLKIPATHGPISKAPGLKPVSVFPLAPDGPPPLRLHWQGIAYDNHTMNPEHCWVYIVKGSPISNPRALIAQGSIEGRNSPSDLPLFGADLEDFIVLIGNERDSETFAPLVLWAEITSDDSTTWEWKPATPDRFPLVDVKVTNVDRLAPPHYTIQVDVEGDETQWIPWIFPLGSPTGKQADTIGNLAALDGHVMLVSGDGETRLQLAIATYSVGGSPGESGYPSGPNPLPSGSADGNAMLFFWDSDKEKIDYSQLYPPSDPNELERSYEQFKIVTVTNPINDAPPPDGYEPRSYAFSVTSNRSFKTLVAGQTLPDGSATVDLHPTLVLYYDDRLTGDASGLEVGRYDAESDRWRISDKAIIDRARERDLGRYLVALTLSPETASGLFNYPPRAEHFRLFLPQTNADRGTPVATLAAYASQQTE